jgi:hypothetical protein
MHGMHRKQRRRVFTYLEYIHVKHNFQPHVENFEPFHDEDHSSAINKLSITRLAEGCKVDENYLRHMPGVAQASAMETPNDSSLSSHKQNRYYDEENFSRMNVDDDIIQDQMLNVQHLSQLHNPRP